MKLSLKNWFRRDPPHDPAAALKLSVAQLLLEIARADAHVGAPELHTIRGHLSAAYGLDPEQLDRLMDQAAAHVEQAVSLYDTVKLINQACGPEEKLQLVRALWQVAYADRRLDAYEEALLRRLADLLYVPHASFIREKLNAQA